ncbi:MAG TPA: hypothetical protein PK294_14665 [Ignavibacteria bacterium]|nr:hypothetical protein [Ignavibacteria bacterium]HQY53569.1 hypothetical protein [Ignavibacteria bacterium]HRB01674.1 hypothetical protein [Ignavibacteria bacterium]
MKKKILLSFVLMTISFLMFISLTGIDNPDEKFLIVAMHSGIDSTSANYSRIKDSLGMNGWHKYNQWFEHDEITSDISFLSPRVQYRVNENNTKDLRTVFGRRITDYTGWGQRSDYQCEVIPYGNDYWFYSYDTSVINTWINDIQDSNATVKYCDAIESSPGSHASYIIKGLKANREQANRRWTPWQSDTYSSWYIKPKIRIPTGLSPNTLVCTIEILDWDGTIVRSVVLKANNFERSSLSPYQGNYLDEFYFVPNQNASPIKTDSTELCPGSNLKDFTNWGDTNAIIKTDFRVYWHGECDMWIDRIRVENEQAIQLFQEGGDADLRIRSEVSSALLDYDPSRPNHFYLEEFEFNTTPCIKKVREIIEEESQGKLTFIANLNPYMYNFHVPNYVSHPFTADEFKKYFIDPTTGGGVKIAAATFYFLEGFEDTPTTNRFSKNPNTLPVYQAFPNLDYNPGKGILAYKTSPADYDNWLQYNFDDKSEVAFNFTDALKISDYLSKNGNFDFYSLHQSYSWFLPSFKLKEPTNEESELTANLAICYGAKGMMYFALNGNVTDNGYNSDYGNNGTSFFIPPLPVFSKSLPEDQLNITADLKQTF